MEATRSWKGQEDSSEMLGRECGPADTLTSDFRSLQLRGD